MFKKYHGKESQDQPEVPQEVIPEPGVQEDPAPEPEVPQDENQCGPTTQE